MSDLKASLETLKVQLLEVDANLRDNDGIAQRASGALGEMRQTLSTHLKQTMVPAASLNARISTVQKDSEQLFSKLQGELKSFDDDLESRLAASQKQVKALLETVQQLSKSLGSLTEQVRAEQAQTESSLQTAANRSQEAFGRSRAALQSLEKFTRESYVPKLQAHEAATGEHRDALAKLVQQQFVPALDAHIQKLRQQLAASATELGQQAQKASEDGRRSLEGTLGEYATQTAQALKKMADQAQDSCQALQVAATKLGEGLTEEQTKEAALLQSLAATLPHAEHLQQIPGRLETVLKKARVIR